MVANHNCQILLTDLVTHDSDGYLWEAVVSCGGNCNYGEENGNFLRTDHFDGTMPEAIKTRDKLNEHAILAAIKSHCPFVRETNV